MNYIAKIVDELIEYRLYEAACLLRDHGLLTLYAGMQSVNPMNPGDILNEDGVTIHDGADYIELPDHPTPDDYVNAAALLMARFMNRYWDCCQQERKPLSQRVRFKIEPGRVVCEGRVYS